MRDRSTSVKGDGTNVLFDVWLVARATTEMLDTALAPSGLTADEYGVYSVLTSADGVSPSEIARWMSAPATTVSSYLKRLERRGHVQRDPNPYDRRSSLVRLTPRGKQAHAEATGLFRPVLERVNTALGRSEPTVRRSLAELRRALAPPAP
jgi:DNA-binding MarR family transcriptional regulator